MTARLYADPYHTYLSIAAAAVVSPDPTWGLQPLDPLINATHETAKWAKEHVSAGAPTPAEPER
jgi:geranylgeranyl transferase type-1 subunit beta